MTLTLETAQDIADEYDCGFVVTQEEVDTANSIHNIVRPAPGMGPGCTIKQTAEELMRGWFNEEARVIACESAYARRHEREFY